MVAEDANETAFEEPGTAMMICVRCVGTSPWFKKVRLQVEPSGEIDTVWNEGGGCCAAKANPPEWNPRTRTTTNTADRTGPAANILSHTPSTEYRPEVDRFYRIS